MNIPVYLIKCTIKFLVLELIWNSLDFALKLKLHLNFFSRDQP